MCRHHVFKMCSIFPSIIFLFQHFVQGSLIQNKSSLGYFKFRIPVTTFVTFKTFVNYPPTTEVLSLFDLQLLDIKILCWSFFFFSFLFRLFFGEPYILLSILLVFLIWTFVSFKSTQSETPLNRRSCIKWNISLDIVLIVDYTVDLNTYGPLSSYCF